MNFPSGDATAPMRFGAGRVGPPPSPCGGGGGGADPMRMPVPPSLSYKNTPKVGSGGRDFETSTYWPSAVHDGDSMYSGRSCVGLSLVTARGLDPSAFAIHTFSTPLRSLRNATVFPSGENFGWLSNDMPPAILDALPPSIGSV